MHLSKLILDDFRSYDDLALDLTPGVTTLLGSNGAGKTNIVEAIRYLGTLSSHRVASDAPLVRTGADKATIRGLVHRAGRTLALEVSIVPKGANTARLNGTAAKPREIAHVLRTVVFSPEDLGIVKGEPAGRRGFLDDLCVAMSPVMAGVQSDYDRIVRQRGALLKSLKGRTPTASTLEVWVLRSRVETIEAVAPYAAAAYTAVAARDADMSLAYDSAVDVATALKRGGVEAVKEALMQAMEEASDRERDRGVCLVGPHRDDLAIEIGGLPARGYASHG
jgi:DNA replication and repair protein RecF